MFVSVFLGVCGGILSMTVAYWYGPVAMILAAPLGGSVFAALGGLLIALRSTPTRTCRLPPGPPKTSQHVPVRATRPPGDHS